MDPTIFPKWVEELSITLSEKQLRQFQEYADFLVAYNENVNLTTITEKSDIYEKHFYDSLLIAPLITPDCRLCDVGSGAGFPGIPLKIVYPNLRLTILEPLQKRTRFLSLLAEKLDLGLTIVNQRAEDATELRETFDVVTARAVANLSILAELCIPLVKKEGVFIAMKGSKGLEEVQQATSAIKELGCKLDSLNEIELPSGEKRINVVYQKVTVTNKIFPRKYAMIKKKPL